MYDTDRNQKEEAKFIWDIMVELVTFRVGKGFGNPLV